MNGLSEKLIRSHRPVILLLHGFPTSSHMFRDLIPDNLAQVIGNFTEAIGLNRHALYIFDYGAPTGLRLAEAHPERITAIITQNGNAYMEGLSEAWGPWQTYWREPTAEHREACRESLRPETIRDWQYLHGSDPQRVSPDGYTLDIAYMSRADAEENQLDLILDYRTNLEKYPAFQKYFRTSQPPLLAVWGKNDPAFIPAGAEAYRRDIPAAEIHFLDTGHFALETHASEIGAYIREFLARKLPDDTSK